MSQCLLCRMATVRNPRVFLRFLAPAVYYPAGRKVPTSSVVWSRKGRRAYHTEKTAAWGDAGVVKKGEREGEWVIPPREHTGDDKLTFLNTLARETISAARSHLEDLLPSESPTDTLAFEARALPIHTTSFHEIELRRAHDYILSRRRREGTALEALRVLTRQYPTRRLPQYIGGVLPLALEGSELQIRELEQEITMAGVDLSHRHYRQQLRWLLDAGRTPEAVEQQYLNNPDVLRDPENIEELIYAPVISDARFDELMAYIMIYRRSFRTARLVMEALAPYVRPHVLGRTFHVYVGELLTGRTKDMQTEMSRETQATAVRAMEFLERMYERRGGKPILIPQTAMFRLCRTLPKERVAETYWRLLEIHGNERALNPRTTHAFIGTLAAGYPQQGRAEWKEGFRILKHLTDRGDLQDTAQARKSAISVLKYAIRDRDIEGVQEILEFMTQTGLDPTNELFHSLLSNAVKEKDQAAIERLHYGMVRAGYKPDMVTLTILHAYYKRAGDDVSRREVLKEALEPGQTINRVMVTDVLHSMVLERRPYAEVYDVYATYFRTGTLDRAGIGLNSDAPKGPTDNTLVGEAWIADHVVFNVMLMSYCQSASVEKVWEFYQLYRKLMYTPRPASDRPMMERFWLAGDQILNIVMVGLGKTRAGLPYVARVLEDMLQPNSITPPTVISWSIFVKFLCLSGKTDEARSVLDVMQRYGVKPNLVTYTTVLKGYVDENRIENAEDWLLEMSHAGISANERTWNTLIRGYAELGDAMGAGDAFRRMLEAGYTPSQATLSFIPQGREQRDLFEAGLAGELVRGDGEQGREGVFVGGEAQYPEIGNDREVWERKREMLRRAEMEVRGMRPQEEDGVFEEGAVTYPELQTHEQRRRAAQKEREDYFTPRRRLPLENPALKLGGTWEERYQAQKAAEERARLATASTDAENVFEEGQVEYPELGPKTFESQSVTQDTSTAPTEASETSVAVYKPPFNIINEPVKPGPPMPFRPTFVRYTAVDTPMLPHQQKALEAYNRNRQLAAEAEHRRYIESLNKRISRKVTNLQKSVKRAESRIHRFSREIAAFRMARLFAQRVKEVEEKRKRALEERVNAPVTEKISKVEVKRPELSTPPNDVPGAPVRIRKIVPDEAKEASVKAARKEALSAEEQQAVLLSAKRGEAAALDAIDAAELPSVMAEIDGEPEVVSEAEYNYWKGVHERTLRNGHERALDSQREDMHRRNKYAIWSSMGLSERQLQQRWRFDQVYRWMEEASAASDAAYNAFNRQRHDRDGSNVARGNPTATSAELPPMPRYQDLEPGMFEELVEGLPGQGSGVDARLERDIEHHLAEIDEAAMKMHEEREVEVREAKRKFADPSDWFGGDDVGGEAGIPIAPAGAKGPLEGESLEVSRQRAQEMMEEIEREEAAAEQITEVEAGEGTDRR